MHNLGTVSASRLTSAPRLEYTKIHGLSICPYQNQSHFNRILKSYPLPPPKVPVSRRCRAPPHIPAPAHLPTAFIPLHSPAPASARTPHIPAPAHLPPVFHIPPPARLRARAPSAGSATAPPLPPRYSPRKSAPNRLPAPRLWCRMSLASEA